MAEDEITLEALRQELKNQSRRLKRLADAGDVDAVAVLRELYGTALSLQGDFVEVLDRLEQHAEWASSEIDALRGSGELASQLIPEDADKIAGFVSRAIDSVLRDDQLSETDKQELEEQGRQVLELVAEVRLEDVVEDEPDAQPQPSNGAQG